MTVYCTLTDTDTFYHLVTDEFHVLQQVRIQPEPCRCLVRDEVGDWRWISRQQALELVAAWQRQAQPATAPASRQAA